MAVAPEPSERRNRGIFSSSALETAGLKSALSDATGGVGAATEPWVTRLMRPGVILLLVFEIMAFTGAIFLMPEMAAKTLPFELFNIGAAATCLALTWTLWFRHHWRITAFLLCSLLVVSGAWISLTTGQTEPLLVMVILLLVGAGSLIPWDQRWQAALILLCVIWLAINALYSPPAGAAEFYRWLVLLAAAALAYCCTSLSRRYRQELTTQLKALENSHHRLREEVEHRERGAAERTAAELKLGEKETTLRKTFEVSLDALSVNRLYDGTFVDFNEEFLRIVGYSRAEVMGHTAHELRLWANRERQQQLMRHLLAEGSIRNMEFEFRHKSGRIAPALISSIAVELSGELCVVSSVRDITDWKRVERDLLNAHQELSIQLQELKESRRRLAEGEDKLRKIFKASLDVMSIRRLRDGRFIDVNPEFERVTGYSKAEAVKLSINELGIWVDEKRRDEFFRRLRAHGSVRNFEADFHSRGDKKAQPNLISASIVDHEGEPHVVAVVRNVAALKRTENELRSAREELSAQVEALTLSQQRLQTEIAERTQAERRLQVSETKLRKVFDATLDAVSIRSIRDDRLIDFNPAFLKATGYSRAEATAKPASELNFWADMEARTIFYRELRARGYVQNVESAYRTKTGHIVPSIASGVMMELEGEPCVLVISRDNTKFKRAERELIDAHQALSAQVAALSESQRRLQTEIIRHRQVITEREQAELRARQSEATLRQVFETSPDSITIRRLSDHKFVSVNEGFIRITGFTRDEVLGKTPAEIGLWVDAARAEQFMERLRAQGAVRNWADDIRMRDGSSMPFLLSASIVRMGDEPCVVVMARDIREIKQTENELISAREALSAQVRALRESETRLRAAIVQRERIMAERREAEIKVHESELKLRTIFEASLDSISLRRSRDACYIDVNREFLELTGYSREEVIGNLAMNDTLWGADRLRFNDVLQRDGFTRDFEAILRCKNGRMIPVMTSAAVVKIEGEPCILALTRDITQIKLAEQTLIAAREEALSASRAKSDFLSSMSHEIRTPMNAILGMADLLWETPLGAHQRRYLETMRANGDALLDLINQVLDLTRIESGQLTLEKTAFDLGELIEKTAEMLGIRAYEKGLELVARAVPGAPLSVIGDPLRLRQILINLLGNAIKFTELGQVVLTVKNDEDHPSSWRSEVEWFRFTVADTGVGIPGNKLKAIFSSFTQADSSITRRYGGTGLGLAIVKRLVELHGGSIQVESQMGIGSTFHFTIPLIVGDSAVDSRRSHSLADARVLVADDNSAARLMIREILADCGASVAEASGGEEAIAMAEALRRNEQPFDLILMDWRMPFTNGSKATARLQAVADSPRPLPERIIPMLTSDDLASSLESLRELGLGAYLVKPIRRNDLLDVVAAVTSGVSNGLAETPALALEPARKQPLKILVAEDSTDNRLLIDAYLRNGNFELDEAENGEVAINKFISHRYDIVLMDVQMPLVDGYTAVRAIRQWESRRRLPRTPIIALTASALDEAIHRSLEAGCDAHVSKPVKRATLIETIYEAVGRSAETRNANGAINAEQNSAAREDNSAIVVEVPGELRKLIPGFIARKRDEAVELGAAVNRRDFEAIANIGHRIKGEGGSYGLDRISEIGAALEESAKRLDDDCATRLTDEFADYVERVQVVYKEASE